jgi:hypothetical protein
MIGLFYNPPNYMICFTLLQHGVKVESLNISCIFLVMTLSAIAYDSLTGIKFSELHSTYNCDVCLILLYGGSSISFGKYSWISILEWKYPYYWLII